MAVASTPRIRFMQRAALTLLVLSGVVNYIDRATLAIANPLVRHDLGLSINDMGYLLSAFLWAYAFAQLPAGALVDRIGPRILLALGEPEGMVKTVFDAKTGELLGAHMIGAEVTEMIQGFAIARTLESTEAELMATVFPHPTVSEAMHESVLDAYGRAIHF